MNTLTFKVSIPTDNGFWGRECTACHKYFKINTEAIKDKMYCPYCGELQSNDDLWTKEQKELIERSAYQEARKIVETEIDRIFGNLAKGNKSFTYKPGPRFHAPIQPTHVEKQVDTEIECPKCNTTFQVFGIFGFCPGCREDNILIYEANLALLIQEIDASHDKNRTLRHAYNDLVSTFESYCKKVAVKFNLGLANFQNLKNAKETFKRNGLDIYAGVSENEKTSIKRVFEKRHAYQHALGKITPEFVKNVPEDHHLLNTTAVLTREEFLEAVKIIKIIIRNITNEYGS